MIRFIVGEKGTGKTKRIIEEANKSISGVPGHVAYIDSSKRNIYELNHKIRFSDTSEFEIKTFDMFYSFICGIISENFDVSRFYIDSLFKIVQGSTSEFEEFIKRLKTISTDYNIDFIITATANPKETPEFLKEYIA